MSDKEISINFKKAKTFFSQKKVINTILIILLLAIIIFGSWIRFQNLDSLKDQTTGEYIPLALDPFYFLRVSETIAANGGNLPDYDALRFRPSSPVEWTSEFLPRATIILYKIIHPFNAEATLQYVNVISPVIYFIIGLILFFLLVLKLTKSKIAAVFSTTLLAIIPSYLYRTMAGFSDHESIGMMAFFAVMLAYVFSMEKLGKQKNPFGKIALLGILTGFLTIFSQVSWGGIAKFNFIIIPISFFIIWLVKFQKIERENLPRMKKYFTFYIAWFISLFVFPLIFSYPVSKIISILSSPSSMMTSIIVLFMISDYLITKNKDKIKFVKEKSLEKYRVAFSLLLAIIVGFAILLIMGINLFSSLVSLISTLARPFGGGRIGNTVAENAQPYISTWTGQIGKTFFWLFYVGLAFIGIEFSKRISKKKNKFILSASWILLISGVLFSKISSSSLFNGENPISKIFYFGSIITFIVIFIFTYFNDNIKSENTFTIMMVWSFFILIAGRSAIRLFFIVTPLICLMSGYAISNLFKYTRKSKDDLGKILLGIIFVVALFASIISGIALANASIYQATYTGPSANPQWQNAMSWVRENTPNDSIFVHWWDYGYWVESLGKRAALADGGHFQGDFMTHMIGRYLLTNPDPKSAMSFMKSNEINYLLIDPTEVGKYSAYSSIGSGPEGGDKEGDRTSWIPVIPMDSSQTRETRDGFLRAYPGGTSLDTDIYYNQNGSEIFLPEGAAGIGGFILEDKGDSLSQPQGVFVYNGNQMNLPIRYLYYDDKLVDFGYGVDATLRLIPAVKQNEGVSVDPYGAVVYLSPIVHKSLFAQLYLMNDPNNLYPTISLAHEEDNQVTASIKIYNPELDLGEFIYYQGFQGPIKIWEVDYSDDTKSYEEFTRFEGEFAEFDDLVQ